MIARIWHGTTSRENASAYEELVTSRIFKKIEEKTGDGFKGAQLLSREVSEAVEFTTIIWFQDMEAVKQLTGEDHETAHITEEARKLLLNYDLKVTHSNLIFSVKIQ